MDIKASNVSPQPAVKLDALVIGAGFSGLYALHKLRGMGFSVKAVDSASDVGGTWYWNRYPGARCDVESLQYSFSFSDEIQQEWRWPDRYALQPDIQAYQRFVADKLDLRKDIIFSTRVISQVYDEEEARWTVKTDTGLTFSTRFCIMATGNLTTPSLPDIKGIETFKGRKIHAARWPEEGVDFSGLRVGLIGTGATGVQLVPKLAAQAAHLYVFQRTPNFSIPARNHPVSDDADKAYKAVYDKKRAEGLASPFGMLVSALPTRSAMEVSPEERERIYEERWQQGGSINFLTAFNDLLLNEDSNQTASEFVRRKIRETVKDPETAEKLCPKDHPIGSKRLCVDTDYYETYNRPNVTLVDIRTDPIQELTGRSLRTGSAEYEIDMLVFATGFDAVSGTLLALDIRGRDNLPLEKKWEDGPFTYLGLMTSGFPNMFLITGAGSPSVKSNMVLSIEQHVDWIADCLAYMRSHGFDAIEANRDAELAWTAHVHEVADKTLYKKANSWYFGSNIPGKPRFFAVYVGGVPPYKQKIDDVASHGYEGFTLTRTEALAKAG